MSSQVPVAVHQAITKGIKKAEKKHQEPKFFEVAAALAAVSATPTLVNLSAVPQGVTVSDRVGDELVVQRLELTYILEQINVNIISTIRVQVYAWRINVTLLAPASTMLLQSSTGAVVNAFPNWDYRTQFVKIYDQMHSLAGLVGSPTEKSTVHVLNVVLRNMPKRMVFSPGTTGSNNALYMLYMSDTSANNPTISYNARLVYVDE